ncbi:MAG: zinc-dependent peptidase [Bacteroidota bacterium]
MIILLLILFIPAVTLLVAFVYTVAEDNYGLLFNKPFYVHFYPSIKTLSTDQSYVLNKQFHYYKTLPDNKKRYFEHRVATFINKYEFIGQEKFIITDEVKVLIASTSVMLTFGMRNYLYSNIDKIIVYPEEYYSTIGETYHKGEFNPRMRAIVFSWQDFKEGFGITNDNLNLGIHEFAHVLHFHGLKSEDASAIIFSRMYNQIQRDVNDPVNREKLINSEYFRIYAYTNQFEFLAVILEHFFETPQEFKAQFPEIYLKVKEMINYNENHF